MAGRPTKYTPERVEAILGALRNGNTRKASSEASGIDNQTFLNWLNANSEFSDAVIRAEAEAEVAFATVLKKAADGVPYERRTETTTTEIRIKKTRDKEGTVTEEPVPITCKSVTVVSGVEYDWRAAESFLKRRRRDDWGDHLSFNKLTDEELIAAAASLVVGGPAASATAGEAGTEESDDAED